MSSRVVRSYRVEFETDDETGAIVVSIPRLNYTADFGDTVEEALRRLRKLAAGLVECLAREGEPIPAGDPPGEGVYLAVRVPRRSAAARRR